MSLESRAKGCQENVKFDNVIENNVIEDNVTEVRDRSSVKKRQFKSRKRRKRANIAL